MAEVLPQWHFLAAQRAGRQKVRALVDLTVAKRGQDTVMGHILPAIKPATTKAYFERLALLARAALSEIAEAEA